MILHPKRASNAGSNEPLVSVVVPCFNQAHLLGEAIWSVERQTYPRIEVVVVDDGSRDRTGAVAKWDGWKCDVRHLRQRNKGLSAARNAGIRASKGDFIVFLDADDRLLPHAVEVGVGLISDDPDTVMVVGRHQGLSAPGQADPGNTPDFDYEPYREAVVGEYDDPDTFRALLRINFIAMPAVALYRRNIFDRIGGFDERLNACEDYDLYLRIAREYRIVRHKLIVAEYRKHPDSMSSDPARMLRASVKVLRRQQAFVQSKPDYQRAYEQGLWFWRAYYGGQIVERVLPNASKSKGWINTIRDVVTLARVAPDVFSMHRRELWGAIFRSPFRPQFRA